jgi:hypothetical protein
MCEKTVIIPNLELDNVCKVVYDGAQCVASLLETRLRSVCTDVMARLRGWGGPSASR